MPRILTDRQHNVDEIIRLYYKATLFVIERLETARTEKNVLRQRRIISDIERALQELAGDTRSWTDTNIPQIYQDGGADAVKDLERIGATVTVRGEFGGTHIDTMKALSDQTFLDFAKGIKATSRNARAVLGEINRRAIQDVFAGAVQEGSTRIETTRRISDVIRQQGITGLVDRGGKRWRLDTYASMLARTKHREVYNNGAFNRLLENGYEYVQVSSHGADDSCGPWEGRILSLNGEDPKYPSLRDAEESGDHIFGPNCKHTFATYVPGLSNRTTGGRRPRRKTSAS